MSTGNLYPLYNGNDCKNCIRRPSSESDPALMKKPDVVDVYIAFRDRYISGVRRGIVIQKIYQPVDSTGSLAPARNYLVRNLVYTQ